MGDMTVGTILTLLVVPVIYAVVERLAEKVKARVRRIITRGEGDVATGEV